QGPFRARAGTQAQEEGDEKDVDDHDGRSPRSGATETQGGPRGTPSTTRAPLPTVAKWGPATSGAALAYPISAAREALRAAIESVRAIPGHIRRGAGAAGGGRGEG